MVGFLLLKAQKSVDISKHDFRFRVLEISLNQVEFASSIMEKITAKW